MGEGWVEDVIALAHGLSCNALLVTAAIDSSAFQEPEQAQHRLLQH